MFPVAPPTQRMKTFAEVNAVPEPIPMQLFELGVPKSVPFKELYVCQPPYVPPLTPASVVHDRPPEVKVPPMPAFPPVESVVAVRDPVMLLVPTIDNPPLVFEIVPLEFACVQATYANVELPVTFKVPFNVELPVILMPPVVLPISPVADSPLQ